MAERKLTTTDVLSSVIKVGLVGIGAGLLGGASTTLRDHRELTHRSITLHSILQKFFDLEQRTLTVVPGLWAAVHRIHHQMEDVALAPFGRIANGVNYIRDNPDKAQGIKIPKAFRHLDPIVDSFTLEKVMEIGTLANNFFRERLGDRYKAPESYTAEELNALLNPREPAYWYSNKIHTGDYTQEDMEDILGGDPHSPSRFSDPNGIRSILMHIPKVSQGAAGLFRAHPELIPEDLQSKDGQYKQYGKWDIALGFGISIAAVLAARGKFTPKDFLIAAVQGSAINSIKIGLQIIGINTVNSLGHAGRLNERQLVRAIQDHEYKIQPNPDGTISTDVERMSWIGRLLSKLTFDEVGRQWEHHNDPSKIAYTSKEGLQAWFEASWGSFVSYLAQSRWFPLINPGSGFDLKEGERRPDQRHPAVKIIHNIRKAN